MSARLAELPNMIANASSFFVDHVEGLRRDGFINKFRVFDLTNMTGLVGQFYYEVAYQLAPDEALLVEAKVPETCGYWSLILSVDVYETPVWVNNHSILNVAPALLDMLIVIASFFLLFCLFVFFLFVPFSFIKKYFF